MTMFWGMVGVIVALGIVLWRVYKAGHSKGEQDAEVKRFIDQQGTIDAIDEFNRITDENDAKNRRNSPDDDIEPWVRPRDRDR